MPRLFDAGPRRSEPAGLSPLYPHQYQRLDSPSLYTSRAPYYDLYQLESALQRCSYALSHSRGPLAFAELANCARISSAAGHAPLADSTWSVLALFECYDKATFLTRTAREHVLFDHYGCSYTSASVRKAPRASGWSLFANPLHP